MTFLVWILFGIICSILARCALRLTFRDPLTLGGVLMFAVGCLVWPIALLGAMLWFCFWAFSAPDYTPSEAVKWPLWWGRFRYKQHRLCRWVWHLGRPPAEEAWLNGWNYPNPRYRK